MHFLIISVILASLAALSVRADDPCPNALIAASDDFKDVPFKYVSKTLDNSVCPGLDNKPSCCPPDVIVAAEDAFNKARAAVIEAQSIVKKAQSQAKEYDSEFDQLKDEVEQEFDDGKITSKQRDVLLNLIDEVQSALDTFISNGLDAFNRCLESVLTYLAGLVCFACDTTWSSYVEINVNNYTLFLDKDTCNSLNGGCIDFYDSVVTFLNAIRNAVSEAVTDLGGDSPVVDLPYPCDNPGNATDDSGESCKDFICNKLFQGANVDTDNALPSDDFSKLARAFEEVSRITPSREFATKLAQLSSTHLVRAHALRRDVAKAVRDTSTQSTVYSADGYPLYSVGEKSSLDKSVDSSSSSLGVSVLLVSVVALLAFFF